MIVKLHDITDDENCHILAVKKISPLLQETIQKWWLILYYCLHSFSTEIKLKLHEDVCRNYGYYYTEIPKSIMIN